jgi:hypothetical protein
MRPSTGKEDTDSRNARELLVPVPRLPDDDDCVLESLFKTRSEGIVGGDASERIRVPAE